jgi:energy-coupling factor transporter ATP-binding protein EcfA2
MSTQAHYPGSRWWKFDFHTHTPASSDYGAGSNQTALKARNHRDWLMDFLNAGIECVAVTDHHCGDWIDPLKAELERMRDEGVPGASGFHLFPGVELSINGTHFLAIFGQEASTSTINELLVLARYDRSPDNAQGICRETNAVTVCQEVQCLGGIFLPAHVDLESSGLFRNTQNGVLRPIFDCEAFVAMEVAGSGYSPPQAYVDTKLGWVSVLGSDSHHPTAKPDGTGRFPGSHFTWVKMGVPSLEALKLALHDGKVFSILRSDESPSGFSPNQQPEEWLESIEIQNAGLMGRGRPARFEFSPWMNALIGGRGSGKSTLVHFIRLVSRREEHLTRLGSDNRVLKTLQKFKKVAVRRGDEGALLEDTRATMIYRKGNERFRLTWLQRDGGTTVESYDAAEDSWSPASSQDVMSRFPIGIFSQDEIGVMAENPSALLQRVDEAIGKPDWDARWEQEMSTFLGKLATIRSQRSRLAEKDRLKGELEDIIKKLALLESPEHAEVFKKARRGRRQQSQMDALFGAYDRIVAGVREQQERLVLHDLPPDVVAPEHPEDAALADADQGLRNAIRNAASTLETLVGQLEGVEKDQRDALGKSHWEKGRLQAEEDYKNLMVELEAKGLSDPAKLAQLTARRQTLEKSLKEIEEVEKSIEQLKNDASLTQDRLLDLRVELQKMRGEFLGRELRDNRYVRIELRPFGSDQDMDRVEAELRRELGCEDGRFPDAIRNPEKGIGLIEDLYSQEAESEEARVEALLESLAEWKVKASRAAKGKESDLPGAFQNFLKREVERRPEYFDRFYAWWPEDSLDVSYSKGGTGRDFISLKNGSAGEKAAALLAFFLAHGRLPLIIDQPENDLDNHLITDLVVKQLRENKKRRQIIVVTHNPNIVVNGDAEMIHAMRFAGGQCSATASGSLQNGAVRTEVCEVMEGGRPALKSRYQRLI